MLISVIVPIYNTVDYMAGCVNSILKQTYQNLEIILVNDGSTDGSGELCDYYASYDNRVRVVHKVNGGVSSARNEGLAMAQGDYIGFVDSDDWIEPRMYEVLYRNATKHQAEISCCPIRRTTSVSPDHLERVDEEEIFYSFEEARCIEAFLQRKYIGFNIPNKIFSKKLLDHLFKVEYKIAEDADFLFQTLLKAKKVVYSNETTYYYFIRPGSATKSGFSKGMFDILKFTDNIFDTVRIEYPVYIGKAYSFVYYQYLTMMNMLIFHDEEEKFENEFIRVKEKLSHIIKDVKHSKDISKRNIYSFYILKYSMPIYRIMVKMYFRKRNIL